MMILTQGGLDDYDPRRTLSMMIMTQGGLVFLSFLPRPSFESFYLHPRRPNRTFTPGDPVHHHFRETKGKINFRREGVCQEDNQEWVLHFVHTHAPVTFSSFPWRPGSFQVDTICQRCTFENIPTFTRLNDVVYTSTHLNGAISNVPDTPSVSSSSSQSWRQSILWWESIFWGKKPGGNTFSAWNQDHSEVSEAQYMSTAHSSEIHWKNRHERHTDSRFRLLEGNSSRDARGT